MLLKLSFFIHLFLEHGHSLTRSILIDLLLPHVRIFAHILAASSLPLFYWASDFVVLSFIFVFC